MVYIFIPNPCKKSIKCQSEYWSAKSSINNHLFQNIQNLPHIGKNSPVWGKISIFCTRLRCFNPDWGHFSIKEKTPIEAKCYTVYRSQVMSHVYIFLQNCWQMISRKKGLWLLPRKVLFCEYLEKNCLLADSRKIPPGEFPL